MIKNEFAYACVTVASALLIGCSQAGNEPLAVDGATGSSSAPTQNRTDVGASISDEDWNSRGHELAILRQQAVERGEADRRVLERPVLQSDPQDLLASGWHEFQFRSVAPIPEDMLASYAIELRPGCDVVINDGRTPVLDTPMHMGVQYDVEVVAPCESFSIWIY